MLCAKPYRQGVEAYGCGQCMPCRINRKRVWVSRIMLEAMGHADSVFVTLTYKPEALPADLSVSKREAQLFLKRLRKARGPFRYFLVGEYGTQSGRPHYHALLFGVADLEQGIIEKAWGKGQIHVGTVTVESAGYCVGYIANARTNRKDIDAIPMLAGRSPEFSVMSRRPGIGSYAIGPLGGSLARLAGITLGDTKSDVPHQYRLGNRKYPLGRLLTGKLRTALNFAQSGEPINQRELRARERIEEAYRLTTARVLEIDAARRRSAQLKAAQAAKFSYLKGKI